ncbi:MAG: hypothetical protein WB290_12120, partial [Smithella sp.]
FSLTLITTALYHCNSRWFEASSCKPAPRALTPHLLCSLVAHLQIEKIMSMKKPKRSLAGRQLDSIGTEN